MKKGLATGLLALVLALPGCVFTRDNEKVTFDMFVFPFIGGNAKIKHEIYENSNRENIENAIDTSIDIVFGKGKLDVKIMGKDREKLWSYRIYSKTGGDKSTARTEIYNSKGDLVGEINGIPPGLPSHIVFNSSSWINYYNSQGSSIDYSDLLKVNLDDKNE